MNKDLISLRNRSFEAEMILKNFASRKRVHLDKEIKIHRLYSEMTRRGIKLNKAKFNEFFFELEKLNYGIVEGKTFEGDPIMFLPITDIKSIGLDSIEILKPIKEVQPMPVPPVKVGLTTNDMVMVVIVKDGQKLTVYVPKNEVDTFTAKMA